MIIIIPFDLSRMDGLMPQGHTVIDRVLGVAKLYLRVSDKSRDAAALLLAKFVSRPDVKRLKMAEFMGWSMSVLQSADSTCSVCVSTDAVSIAPPPLQSLPWMA